MSKAKQAGGSLQNLTPARPSGPILTLKEIRRIADSHEIVICEYCGGEITHYPQRCPALDHGRCVP